MKNMYKFYFVGYIQRNINLCNKVGFSRITHDKIYSYEYEGDPNDVDIYELFGSTVRLMRIVECNVRYYLQKKPILS